jgi:UDP-2-acetamido-2-deoxy-ribo-hexuluronate aminotransferase
MNGASPIFVDVKIDQTICPVSAAKAINKKTKAIMLVHFTGVLADYKSIKKIIKKKNILIIEDAAQAFGANFGDKYAGNLGDISIFSFNPMKILQGFGEAGAVLCDTKKINNKIRELRHLGTTVKNPNLCNYIELNHKIDELHAALLIESFKNFKRETQIRKKLISRYIKLLKDVCIYSDHDVSRSSGYDYQILVKDRNRLQSYLKKRKIETRIKHPILLCNQKTYKNNKKMNIKNAQMICKHSLSLPLHKYLNFNEQNRIISEIRLFYKK